MISLPRIFLFRSEKLDLSFVLDSEILNLRYVGLGGRHPGYRHGNGGKASVSRLRLRLASVLVKWTREENCSSAGPTKTWRIGPVFWWSLKKINSSRVKKLKSC